MKHNKTIHYLNLRALFFVIPLLFYACQKDTAITEESNIINPEGFHYSTFMDVKNLRAHVKTNTQRLLPGNNVTSRNSEDTYNFSIDTMVVQTLATERYTSYTFIARLNEPDTTKLHNYVLTLFDNDSINEMLVAYPRIYSNTSQKYDMEAITARPVDGDLSIFGRSLCDGYPVTSWDAGGGNCVDYNCGLSGNHSPGEACADGVYRAYSECSGAWVTQCLPPSDNDENPDDSSGGGGSSGNDDAIDIIPLDDCEEGVGETGPNGECFIIVEEDEELGEDGLTRECRKISDLLEENPEYKTKLLQLANEASTATFEKGAAIDEDGNDVNIPDGVGGKIVPPLNPSEKYLSIAHIHDSQGDEGNGTFSVPSLNDMANLGHISVIYDKAKLNKMVYFVFTADGTYYALTINSPNRFKAFWAYQKLLHGDATALTQEQRDEYVEALKNRGQPNNNGIYYRYYNNENGSLIDETSTDNEQQLKYFLQFLQEEDSMGVSVFETNATLSEFKEVKLDENNPNNTPQRNGCN